jgi:hypothetical protein
MKKVILIALFIPSMLNAQVSLDFENGSCEGWIQSPGNRWAADTATSLAGNFSLHHVYDNPEAGTDRAGIPVNHFHPDEGTSMWSFSIKHGYAPSSTNNWAVFLMSDADPQNMSFGSGTNGFAVGVDITGYDDLLKLVKIKEGLITTVVSTVVNWETQIGSLLYATVSVERSAAGEWSLSVKKQDGTTLGEFTGNDPELFSHEYFGIIYRYTSTKDRLLWLDDLSITGVFYSDVTAPSVTGKKIQAKNSVSVSFSEKIADSFFLKENFSINSSSPVSVIRNGEGSATLVFKDDLKNKQTNTLFIKKVCDASGNCSENIEVVFNPLWADPGDVIIAEIMSDPDPVVSLPAAEYIEIANRTEYIFNLEGWKLSTNERSCDIPDGIINPGEIIILCSRNDTSSFKSYGKTIGLASFPSLSNEGMVIYLTDSSGLMIHGVEYNQSWYDNELKAEGGWSLEMKDGNFPFSGKENWKASASRKGGTPGTGNSVACQNPDHEFRGLSNVFAPDTKSIIISFSEPVISQAEKLSRITINGTRLKSIRSYDPLCRVFRAEPDHDLEPGIVCTTVIPEDLSDFAGNLITSSIWSFALTETSEKGDVVFNELLFNPLPGYPDYIELFNSSEKTIDASRLYIASVNDETSDTSELYQVSLENRCIMPGTYYAITTGTELVTGKYFTSDESFIFEVNDLPSMSDDKGHLLLFNRELDLIDEVRYDEKMHYSLISDAEGKALERVSAGNWHTAAESSGWGTPGKQNSVFTEEVPTDEIVSFSSSKITPDSDGMEDLLNITLKFPGIDNVVSIIVFDEAGSPVKKLASNLLSGPESVISWDGTADDGTPVRTGIYIVFISYYNENGNTGKWKKVCTVIR